MSLLSNYQNSQSTEISTRLHLLRLQIYKPYKSLLLNAQNQQQDQKTYQKKFSMQLKKKKINTSMFQSLARKKVKVKLPSLAKQKYKQKTSKLCGWSINDLVPDPFLNGKIRNQRQDIISKIQSSSNQYKFLVQVEKNEFSFLQNCYNKNYKQAESIIIKLMNYAVDLNLIDELTYSIKILADFNYQCLFNEKAFFYYGQCRKCSYLTGLHYLMVESLVNMALCATRANFYTEAIRILKKSLQYAWFYDIVSLQLRAYDEIGKAFYMMGDTEKAKNYHHKYFTGSSQPQNSSIRLLSKQSLILDGLNQKQNIRSISSVFLWMIHLPIKQHAQLSQFMAEQSQQSLDSPRKTYAKNMKYFEQFKNIDQYLIKLFAQDFFTNQLGQMYFRSADWTLPIRNKKYLSYDIQRNNHLQSLGIQHQQYFTKANLVKQKIPQRKRMKTEQIKIEQNVTKSPQKYVDDWLALVTSSTVKKHRNNHTQMANRVNLRGIDKQSQATMSSFRILYNKYFELTETTKNLNIELLN